MMFWNKKKEVDPVTVLAELLSKQKNQEDFLGVSPSAMPQPNELLSDAAKLLKYSYSDDYKVFAKEAWARVLMELDKVLDPRTPVDQLQNARGALRATLDLLRLSYQARFTKENLDRENQQSVPLAR
jgi:hypothetical protein